MEKYDAAISQYYLNAESGSDGEDVEEVKVNIEKEDEVILSLSGDDVLVSDVINSMNERFGEQIFYDLLGDHYSIDSSEKYSVVKSELKSSIETLEKKIRDFDKNKDIMVAVEKYNSLVKYAKEDLQNSYKSYIDELKEVLSNLNSIVDGVYAIEAAEEKLNIDDLNKKGEAAATKNKTADELIAGAKAELDTAKKEAKAAEGERKEAYDKAKTEKNYMMLGSNVAMKFTVEVTSDTLDDWYTNYTDKVNKLETVSVDGDIGDDSFSSAIKSVEKYTSDKNIIKEYNSLGGQSYNMSAQMEQDVKQGIVNAMLDQDMALKTKKSNDDYDSKEYISDSKFDNIYGDLPTDYSEKWFTFDEKESYYLSEGMTFMLMSFLAGQIKKDGEMGDVLDALKTVLEILKNLCPADPKLNNHIGNCELTNDSRFPSYYYKNSSNTSRQQGEAKKYANNQLGTNGNIQVNGNDYFVNTDTAESQSGIFGGREPGTHIVTLVGASSATFESIESFVRNVVKLNIIGILCSLWDFCSGIIAFIKALIEFVIDVVVIIGNILTNPADSFVYVIDQLYIGYYMSEHFNSRQTSTEKSGFAESVACVDEAHKGDGVNWCVKNEGETDVAFKSAKMEYLLIGDNCEITNQRSTYYAMFAFRLILNLPIAFSGKDAFVTILKGIPFVGAFMPFIAIYFDSKLDLAFMISGYKVPLLKDKMLMWDLSKKFWGGHTDKQKEMNEKNKDKAKEYLKSLVFNDENVKNKKTKAGRFVWKKGKTKNGKMYNKYQKVESPNDKLNKYIDDTSGVSANADVITIEKGKAEVRVDYEVMLNVLLALYPANLKSARIADLIQMDGMESDSKFKLKDAYTYVYSDVEAEFSPALPLLSDGPAIDGLKIGNIQMNGY